MMIVVMSVFVSVAHCHCRVQSEAAVGRYYYLVAAYEKRYYLVDTERRTGARYKPYVAAEICLYVGVHLFDAVVAARALKKK
jgi:hypothetical protein